MCSVNMCYKYYEGGDRPKNGGLQNSLYKVYIIMYMCTCTCIICSYTTNPECVIVVLFTQLVINKDQRAS